MGVELRPRGVACTIQHEHCYQNPPRDAGNVPRPYDLEAMHALEVDAPAEGATSARSTDESLAAFLSLAAPESGPATLRRALAAVPVPSDEEEHPHGR